MRMKRTAFAAVLVILGTMFPGGARASVGSSPVVAYCNWYNVALQYLDVSHVPEQMETSNGALGNGYQPLTAKWIKTYSFWDQWLVVRKVGAAPPALSKYPTGEVRKLARDERAFFARLHPGHYSPSQIREAKALATAFKRLPPLALDAPECTSSVLGSGGVWINGMPYYFVGAPTPEEITAIKRMLPLWEDVGGFPSSTTATDDAAILAALRVGLNGQWTQASVLAYNDAANEHNQAVAALRFFSAHEKTWQLPPALTADAGALLQAYTAWYYLAGSALATHSTSTTAYQTFADAHAKIVAAWGVIANALNTMGRQSGIPGNGTINLLTCNTQSGCPAK